MSFSPMTSQAAKVLQIKGSKVLIDLEGESVEPDQQSGTLINDKNKRVALVQITQIKNGKAIGTIVKGQAQGNERVVFSLNNVTGTGPTGINSNNQVFRTSSKRISGLLTLMSNQMDTKQSDNSTPPLTETVSMKGSTIGLTAAVDWPMYPNISLRATLGYEPFKTTGTAVRDSCDSRTSKNCSAEINYLSAGGYGRYDFTKTRTQFWAALGGTLKQPISKTTTALKSEDVKLTMTYALATGVDFFLTNKTFIPFSLEYQGFQNSSTVNASIMLLRVGYGQTF